MWTSYMEAPLLCSKPPSHSLPRASSPSNEARKGGQCRQCVSLTLMIQLLHRHISPRKSLCNSLSLRSKLGGAAGRFDAYFYVDGSNLPHVGGHIQWDVVISAVFVGFDTCLVGEMLVLPSDAHAAPSLPSLRMPDGDSSDHSRDYFSLECFS